MATKEKSALELIRTPEEMARLQDEEIAVKEGYHLGKVIFFMPQNEKHWRSTLPLSQACNS
jgi:hypothetical protein